MTVSIIQFHTDRVVQHADDARSAVRAINHATISGPVLPAPTVYAVLGSLGPAVHGLHQALTQLGTGLAASLDAYAVYEDDGRDPAVSITRARSLLTEAADLAHMLGVLLEEAQSTISRQGYRTEGDWTA